MNAISRDQLISLIFSGVEEAPPWESLIRSLRRELTSVYTGIVLRHSSSPVWDGFVTSDAEWDIRIWREKHLPEHFEESSPFLKHELEPGQLYRLDQFMVREQWRLTRVYRELFGPVGMDHILCLCLGEPSGYRGHLYIGRGDAVGNYSEKELDFCRSLLPWLQQALRLFSKLMRATVEHDIAEDTLSHMGIGNIVMNPAGGILSVDHVAKDILRRSKQLSLINGRFQIQSVEAAARFDSCCRDLLAAGHAGGARAFRLRQPGQPDLPMLIRLTPPDRDYGQAVNPCLLVYISDPGVAPHEPTREVIAELFGLTKSEASVALLLVWGLTLTEVAGRLGLTLGTVRIYLKRIFSKAGVNRQAALVRAISTSLAMLGG